MNYLHLHRRHGRKCAASRPLDSLTSESDENKRGAKQCACPIFASGTLDGISKKITTRQTEWAEARRVIQPYLDAGSWEIQPPSAPAPPPVAPPPSPSPSPGASEEKRTPMKEAFERFAQDHRTQKTAEATMVGYGYALIGRKDGKPSDNLSLREFAEQRGIEILQQFTRPLVKQLYNSWTVEPGTRRKRLSILKGFFEFFVEEEDLKVNPARTIKRRKNAANQEGLGGGENEDDIREPRIGYSDEELVRMFEACKTYGKQPREWPQTGEGHKGKRLVSISDYREYARKITGRDLADFIRLSVESGMRCVNVAKFNASRLQPNGLIRLRTYKRKTWISGKVSAELQTVIQERERRVGSYIFGDPKGRTASSIYQAWYRCLNDLWAQMGPWEHPPTHHRFRHTFVRIMLQRGVSPAMVGRMIGDSEQTVRDHYSNWCQEFQDDLTKATAGAFDKLPRLG